MLTVLSMQGQPDAQFDAKLFPGVNAAKTQRVVVEARMPEPTEASVQHPPEETGGHNLGLPTHYHLRQRKARMDAATAACAKHAAAGVAALAAEAPQEAAPTAAEPEPELPQPEEAGSLDHLAPEQKAELEAVLEEYKGQVSQSSDDMGAVPDSYSEFFFRIPTEEGAKCKQRPYRLSYTELQEFERQLANLLAKGVIKRADRPTDFLSPVLFVPKPRDPSALRMCVDFRRLNAVAKRDFHALPAVLQMMKGCRYFTALDLSSGFWALPIAEEDQHKTAFAGPDGEVYV